MSNWQSGVSARIAAIRQQRGLSLSALAKRAGVSKATLSGIEANRGNPTLDTIERLAVALAIPVADLLSHDERATTVDRAPGNLPDAITQDLMIRLPAARAWEFWRLMMPAAAAFDGVHHVPGTAELLLVIAGQLTAGPADEQTVLNPGDLLEFSGDCAHHFTAGPDGAHVLVALGSTADDNLRQESAQ